MAKAKFIRNKPHVNVATISPKLQAMGFTSTAVRELANGQMPSFPGDRTLLVSRFVAIVSQTTTTRIFSGEVTGIEPNYR